MATITGTYAVCTDCNYVAANGNDLDHDTDREPLGLLDGYVVNGGNDHDDDYCERETSGYCPCDDLGFSMSPCEGCGSRLGGDRYAVSVLA